MFNPSIQGWLQDYERFHRSTMHWVARIPSRDPKLWVHWQHDVGRNRGPEKRCGGIGLVMDRLGLKLHLEKRTSNGTRERILYSGGRRSKRRSESGCNFRVPKTSARES